MVDKLSNSFREFWAETRKFIGITWWIFTTAVKVRRRAVIANLCGAALEIFASLLTIYATAQVAALLAAYITGKDASRIWFWLAVDIAAAALSAIGFWLMRYNERLLYFSMNRWAVDVFYSSMNRVDIAGFYDDETRNQINKVQNGYNWQIPNLSYMVLELIYGVARFLVIALVVAQIGWWLVIVIALFLIPTLLSDSRIAKISWLIWEEKGDNRHVFNSLNYMLSQPARHMELRGMQAKDYVRKKVKKINNEFYERQENRFKKASKVSFWARVFEVGGTAVGSIVLLRQFLSGSIALDRYFFLSGALLRVGGALNAIFGTLSRMQDAVQFAGTFYELAHIQPKISDKQTATKVSSKQPPTIEFDSVSFTYPGQTHPVLENFNLSIKSGEHVAFVGENGAGKSTIIKLLMRFYLPDKGEIRINGVNIQDIAIDSWYSQIATLFQSFNEYPFPIDENIYISHPSSKENASRLQDAATLGGVDTLVSELDYGWETVLDASFEKGVEPSGGQWQRVGLARTFYKDAGVLILDEPTSAIDAGAEYNIFNAIFERYHSRTALIVSHRFSTVRRANRIIVIQNGTIIEEGSHSNLMKKDGIYKDLFSKQAEGYR